MSMRLGADGNHAYPHLFAPFENGRLRLKNRLLMMATVNNLGTNEHITPAQNAFYEERARGGVAAIVTEGLSVHWTSIPNPTIPLAFREELLPDLRQLAQIVHGHGTSILGQLWHVGRSALWDPALVPWSPSAERDPLSGCTPHAATLAEIQELIQSFAQTAERLKRAGFDGVEIHGAHGYLITQFLSPWSNRRSDDYGGSAVNRARFLQETLEQIRRACGAEFVIGLKLSIDEFVDGGLTAQDSREIITLLRRATPPDYIGVSQSNFASLERHLPDMRYEPAPFLRLAEEIREAADGIPIVFMGRVADAAHAESILAMGSADLIGMSRALIADAHLPRKAWQGIPEQTRPCIFCNVCWEAIHSQRAIACIHSPEAGRELERAHATTGQYREETRTVQIVGTGPAGLQAALSARQRGHTIHVYDERNVAGGQTALGSLVPGRSEYTRIGDYLCAEARRLGVEFHLGTCVDAGTVEGWIGRGDAVLLATGSEPDPIDVPGAEAVFTLESALEQGDWTGERIVLIDEIEDEPTYATAEVLVERGAHVRLLTRRTQIGRRMALVSLMGAFRRLDEAGVELIPLHVPVHMETGSLIVRHVFSSVHARLSDVSILVSAGPYRARDALARELRRRGHEVQSIGDAYAPRRTLVAVLEGYRAGQTVSGWLSTQGG
jgi:2,4-dienoyl-CoA reductase-like NADH-dependent reductase (Old Yellow Enzyme family)